MKIVIIKIVLLGLLTYTANAQNCVSVSAGNWQGATQMGVGGMYGTDSVVVSVNNLAITISDLSAGFFNELGHSESYAITFTINCDGSIKPTSFDSKFGPIQLMSGNYNAEENTLTLLWEVPGSGVQEKTLLTYE